MAKYQTILLQELKLDSIEPWKRIGENWAYYKTSAGQLFAKISCDQNVKQKTAYFCIFVF